ncbi:MAG: MFS transporter, partial [Sinobacterium sp.]|nr:MFS transporter [Sinobacterium sp.]
GLIPGSLSLILADHLPWNTVFVITASFLLITLLLSFKLKEASIEALPHVSFLQGIKEPFAEFIERNGLKHAGQILLFMLLYKLGDTMATTLSTPFYLHLGFSKTEIGIVAKSAALWPMIIGGMFGGVLMLKIGINRALWLFGVVQLITILGFAVLAEAGNNMTVLAIVIALEYLGVGLGTAAFVAFIARATSRKFAATQFALLTAFAVFPRTLASALTGFLVEYLGWTEFYFLCALLALPGMAMLFLVAPFNSKSSH